MMKAQSFVLILVLILSSYSSLSSKYEHEKSDFPILEQQIEKIRISPNPDSIRSLGSPEINSGIEQTRIQKATSRVGEYNDQGLISTKFNNIYNTYRDDLMIFIVKSDIGLWDAREQISDFEDVSIRATIPPSGYLIQGIFDELVELGKNPIFSSSHRVPVALNIHQDLWFDTLDLEVEIIISGWKDISGERMNSPGLGFNNSIEVISETYLTNSYSPKIGTYQGTTTIGEMILISHDPSISFISPVIKFSPTNNVARGHLGADTVENYYSINLFGSGQTIAIADTGIDADHGDFDSGIVVVDVEGDGSTADTNDGHGTHVACTVLGSGSRNIDYQGVAPEAGLYFQAMENDDTNTFGGPGIWNLLNSAYNTGNSRIHSNSWGGIDSGGDYNTQSEDADELTSKWDQYWLYEGMSVLFSAGNEGDAGIAPPGTAKNVITVGGHVNRYDIDAENQMYESSSRGPTDDGRLKPDIVAPGDYVRSCKAQEAENAESSWESDWYIEYSGTSMATPVAAGASIIVREYLMDIVERPAPQGSLIKALLILGAQDMGARDIPNNDEGWGRLDLVNSLIPQNDIGIFVDDRSRLSSGQESDYSFEITRPNEELKIVLTWSDYPGSSFSSTQLMNDLDLEVTSPDGQTTYLGNVFSNGKSVTGGIKDSKNNVEVVLIDSASEGIWNVNVKDSSHGGNRIYQPYSIAVRGVNVNDLTPDPAIISDSFTISVPVPQVDEQVDFSISISNQGTGFSSNVPISAYFNSNLVDTKFIDLNPGETTTLEWEYVPQWSDKGSIPIQIYIDETNLIDEASELNNEFAIYIDVSAPGIQPSVENPTYFLIDATQSVTKWEITLTNSAEFEKNASISASNPIRESDSLEFNWLRFFDNSVVNLGANETTTVNLTMSHPSPPEPGVYNINISAEEIETGNILGTEIAIDVPVLSQVDLLLPSPTISVDPFEISNFDFDLKNLGNGAQAYDLELISPAGWKLGFDEIGTTPGSSRGSTGIMSKEGTISPKISVEPPGILISAGTIFTAQVLVKSRVSSDFWSIDIPLEIKTIKSVNITSYGGLDAPVAADALHEISLIITNTGNTDLSLNPVQKALPGGWSIPEDLQTLNINQGQTNIWSFFIQGNGFAQEGSIKLRFQTEDGFNSEWNDTIEVKSSALPILSFNEVSFTDGTFSNTPLGAGAYPVGLPGFDMGWIVYNSGTSVWEPEASMQVPSNDWNYSCIINPTRISPGNNATIWCTMVIPEDEEAGSEPQITLMLSSMGVEVETTLSLLVEYDDEVTWNLRDMNEAHEGYSSTLIFDLQNTGNTIISSKLITDGPEGWDIRIKDGILVTLVPQESRSVTVTFTPDGSDGVVELNLLNSEHISGSKILTEIDVIPDPSKSSLPNWIIPSIFVFISFLSAIGVFLFRRNSINSNTKSSRVHRDKGTHYMTEKDEKWISKSENISSEYKENKVTETTSNYERFADYPGWLWDPSKEEWIPDPDYSSENPPQI